MAKVKLKTAQDNSFFEEDDDFLTHVEASLDETEDEDFVPDDEYEPEVPDIPEPTMQGRPLIVREVRPDTLTVIRNRVVLTRSMCIRKGCNYDAAREMGYTEYKRIPPNRRPEVAHLLATHKMIAHSANDNHIVFENDLQTGWFGVDDMTGKPRRVKVNDR
jgi:hypothetical protein